MRIKVAILMAIAAALLVTVAGIAGRPIHRVYGGATDSFPMFGTEHYAFTAQIDEAGDVSGQGSFSFVIPVVKFHAVFNCLAVEGNEAWLGMTVTKSDNTLEIPNGIPVGQNLIWQLRDNGQGAKAKPDEQSLFFLSAACSGKPDLFSFATFQFDTGNIIIK